MLSIEFLPVRCDLSAMAGTLQILTANRLQDGAVVYWRAGSWVGRLGEGEIFEEQAAADSALATAQEFVVRNLVINPYLFDVRRAASGIEPVKEREIIRARGPSVRDDLGKQATPAVPEDPYNVSI